MRYATGMELGDEIQRGSGTAVIRNDAVTIE
jgi:hypothetical protein